MRSLHTVYPRYHKVNTNARRDPVRADYVVFSVRRILKLPLSGAGCDRLTGAEAGEERSCSPSVEQCRWRAHSRRPQAPASEKKKKPREKERKEGKGRELFIF